MSHSPGEAEQERNLRETGTSIVRFELSRINSLSKIIETSVRLRVELMMRITAMRKKEDGS